VHACEAAERLAAALDAAAIGIRLVTALTAPAPVAVEHEGHPGPLLACSICRRRASQAVFRRRYWALRSRRTGIARSRLGA
jgi:hypothetical protein